MVGILPYLPLLGFRRKMCSVLWAHALCAAASKLSWRITECICTHLTYLDALLINYLLYFCYMQITRLYFINIACVIFQHKAGLGVLTLSLNPQEVTQSACSGAAEHVLADAVALGLKRYILCIFCYREQSRVLSWCISLEFQSCPCCKVGGFPAWVKAEPRI